MEYNRYQEQCSECDCYYENLDEATVKELEEHIGGPFEQECTLEQDCWAHKPCRFFQNKDGD